MDPETKSEVRTPHGAEGGQMTTRPSNVLDTEADFAGDEYQRKFDHERLSGQIRDIYDIMSDGEWRTRTEIRQECERRFDRLHPDQSIGSQLRNLRLERYGSYEVEKRIRGKRRGGLWEYRVGDAGANPPADNKSVYELLSRIEKLEEALRALSPDHPLLSCVSSREYGR